MYSINLCTEDLLYYKYVLCLFRKYSQFSPFLNIGTSTGHHPLDNPASSF